MPSEKEDPKEAVGPVVALITKTNARKKVKEKVKEKERVKEKEKANMEKVQVKKGNQDKKVEIGDPEETKMVGTIGIIIKERVKARQLQ